MLSDQAIIRSPDHYQRHQVNAERIPALLAVGFDIDPMQAHLPDSAICPWKNRFMLAETHLSIRTERELIRKLLLAAMLNHWMIGAAVPLAFGAISSYHQG
jgi:hypothetical protein